MLIMLEMYLVKNLQNEYPLWIAEYGVEFPSQNKLGILGRFSIY